MAVIYRQSEQIITLSAGDTYSDSNVPVESIILRGTAAGTFVVNLGTTQLSLDNSANALTLSLPINRSMNSIGLVSGPAGATMYVLLEKKM
jgi:hypothetical protein